MFTKKEVTETVTVPPIDLMVPAELQTATFAYG